MYTNLKGFDAKLAHDLFESRQHKCVLNRKFDRKKEILCRETSKSQKLLEIGGSNVSSQCEVIIQISQGPDIQLSLINETLAQKP